MSSAHARRIVALIGAGAILLGGPLEPASAWDVAGDSVGDSVTMTARESRAAEDAWNAAKSAGDPVASLVEYARAEQCNVASAVLASVLNGPCPPASGTVAAPYCGDGVTALEPLWTRTRTTATTPWTPWSFVTGASCPCLLYTSDAADE